MDDTHSGRRRILLIDQRESVSDFVGMLSEGGISRQDISIASRLDTGQSILQKSEFDCVVMNLFLPDAIGRGGLERIRLHNDAVPIVALSHCDDDAMKLSALGAGAQEFLHTKQVSVQGLSRAIGAAIERKQAEYDHLRNRDEVVQIQEAYDQLLAKTAQQQQECDGQLRSYKQRISRLESDGRELRKTAAVQQAALESTQHSHVIADSEWRREMAKLREANQALQAQLEVHQDAQLEMQQLHETCDELREQVRSATQGMDAMRNRTLDRGKRYRALIGVLRQCRQRNDEMSAQSLSEISKYQAQIEQLSDRVRVHDQRCRDQHAALESAQRNHAEADAERRNELSKLRESNQALQEQLKVHQDAELEMQRLYEMCDELREQVHNAAQGMNAMRRRTLDRGRRCRVLTDVLRQSRQRNDEISAQSSSEILEHQAKIEQLKNQVRLRDQRRRDQQIEANSLQQTIAEHVAHIEHLSGELEQSQMLCSRSDQRASRAERALAGAQGSAAKLAEIVRALESQRTQDTAYRWEQKHVIAQLGARLDKALQQRQNAMQELANLRREFTAIAQQQYALDGQNRPAISQCEGKLGE